MGLAEMEIQSLRNTISMVFNITTPLGKLTLKNDFKIIKTIMSK